MLLDALRTRRLSTRWQAMGPGTAGLMVLMAGACQPQLFPGDESPTQLQRSAMGFPAPQEFNLEEGDNEDPMMDDPTYPYPSLDGGGAAPWYAQPGYMQG
ncbi:MAG: hypothetical protein U0574_12030 [Phycisphaerales bacterium]